MTHRIQLLLLAGVIALLLVAGFGPIVFARISNPGVTSSTSSLTSPVGIADGGTGLTSSGASSTVLTTNGTAAAWQLVSLSTSVYGDLPFANLTQVSANSVLGNITGSTADAASVATSSLYNFTGTGDTVRSASPTLTGNTTMAAASTTDLTAATSMQLPNSTSQAPTVSGYIGVDTTDGQLVYGSGGATKVVDGKIRLTIDYATSTTWAGPASSTVFVIPQNITWNTWSCTVQPAGATLTAQYMYANPSAYANVFATSMPASTTPGVYTFSSNNTPTTGATSTLGFSVPAGAPTSASCTLVGMPTAS